MSKEKMAKVEEYIYNQIILPLVKDGKVTEQDLDSQGFSFEEKKLVLYIMGKRNVPYEEEKIKKEDRSKLVRDHDYGEVQANGLVERDEPVIQDNLDEEEDLILGKGDHSDLERFLDEVFIPQHVTMKKRKIKGTDQYEVFPSIQLNKIVGLRLSELEEKQAINYLKEQGIRVRGVNSTLDGEFENYDYIRTYKSAVLPKALTGAETLAKFRLLKLTGDPLIREQIIIGNMRLVSYIAWRLARRYNIDINELNQSGYEGLIKAVDSFDLSKGCMFSTYAYMLISHSLGNAITQNAKLKSYDYSLSSAISTVESMNGQTISENPALMEDVLELLDRSGQIRSKLEKQGKTVGRPEFEIAMMIEKEKEKYRKKLNVTNAQSIDQFVEEGIDVFETGDLINIGATYEPPEKYAIDALSSEALLEAVSTLSEREQIVIKLRYGLEDGKARSLEDIGNVLGITRERVRQIEMHALRKLRRPHLLSRFHDNPYLTKHFSKGTLSQEENNVGEESKRTFAQIVNDPELSNEEKTRLVDELAAEDYKKKHHNI